MPRLNRTASAMPKRDRVREHLLGLIEAGRPGDPIPSERLLSDQLAVSRPTLRAVVDELIALGHLVRRHGRGTFIAADKITQQLVSSGATMGVPRASGFWTSRILTLNTVQAGARISRKLNVSPATELRYISRLRLVDGVPMAIEHLHIPARLVPRLTTEELEAGELYDHLRDHHDVHVCEAVQSIEPTVVSESEAGELLVPVLSPALLIERLTYDRDGQAVEYVRSIYRGDRYRIVSRLALADTASDTTANLGHQPGIPPGDFSDRGIVATTTTGDVQ